MAAAGSRRRGGTAPVVRRGQLAEPADRVGPDHDDHDHHDHHDHDDARPGPGPHSEAAEGDSGSRCCGHVRRRGRPEQVRRRQRIAPCHRALQGRPVELLQESIRHLFRPRRRGVLGLPGAALLIRVL